MDQSPEPADCKVTTISSITDDFLGTSTKWKVSKYEVISGSYFPVFGLNTEIFGVNLRI